MKTRRERKHQRIDGPLDPPQFEELARVDVDDQERLQPYALRGLHREEVERPERILRPRAHAIERHRPAGERRKFTTHAPEAMQAQDFRLSCSQESYTTT